MKPVILDEKPIQAKAYADAFSVRRHEGYLEINPCPIFPEGAYITWGIGQFKIWLTLYYERVLYFKKDYNLFLIKLKQQLCGRA